VVHDLSAMRESDARRFLAGRVGQEICVSYRVDHRGAVEVRPEPWARLATLTAMVALLAACAGHGGGVTAPEGVCLDGANDPVSCPDVSKTEPQPVAGCVVRPAAVPSAIETASPTSEDASTTVAAEASSVADVEPPMPVATATDADPSGAESDAAQLDPLGLLPGGAAPGVGLVTSTDGSAAMPRSRRVIEYRHGVHVTMGAMVVGPEWNQASAPSTIDLWIEARERRSHRTRHRRRRRAGHAT
jgi:hypothetical protein